MAIRNNASMEITTVTAAAVGGGGGFECCQYRDNASTTRAQHQHRAGVGEDDDAVVNNDRCGRQACSSEAISAKRDKCFLSCITDKSYLSSKADMKNKVDAGYPIRTPQQLGAVLQGYRKQRGLTQAQVARGSGLLQSAVSELELDSSTASLNRIFKLLAALELELAVRPRGKKVSRSEW